MYTSRASNFIFKSTKKPKTIIEKLAIGAVNITTIIDMLLPLQAKYGPKIIIRAAVFIKV